MTYTKSINNPKDPESAFAAVLSLRIEADKLELRAVKDALEQGWSWSQIADALGVTKQAAHKRFSARFK